MKSLSRRVLRALGWTVHMDDPLTHRYVLIVAPHTSNWDFPLGLLAAWALDLKANWMGKHSLFRGPLGPVMRALGGIPVDRDAASDLVQQMADRFAASDHLVLGMAPEGTRSHAEHWKSGFWRIARAAQVPIAMAYLDYDRREVGLGGAFMPSDDRDADFARIAAFYDGRVGLKPENQGTIQARPPLA
ncbi:MAG: lysophospholipid acyltransferase family protein [Xanthomonadales bacterium]|jgi:1-acyl-sn-glycerol-3-phosphate acyltransferase|nr:lysophospholipid acyltransferase family protein [Xanthomonadales bacterium]